MGTAVNSVEEAPIIDGLIRPAIMRLISESEGAYRCERDLHHHLTTCLAKIANLELGTPRRRVFMEEPALACYGSGRKGNLDYFFPDSDVGASWDVGPRDGVAMELNYNYRDCFKVKKDIQKLIDPASGYQRSLYFAYGSRHGFYESVQSGIERAFASFEEVQHEFRLPMGFRVIVVEYTPGGGEHLIHEASVATPCVPAELQWEDTQMPKLAIQLARTKDNVAPVQGETESVFYIDRNTAEVLLHDELVKAQIPLKSKTARCMFETTRNSAGGNRCKLGVTPLWGNEVRVVKDKVLRSEFMDWVQRLCDSGQAFQRAGRASWG